MKKKISLFMVSCIALAFVNCSGKLEESKKRVYSRDEEADMCYSSTPNDGAAGGLDPRSTTYVPCTDKVLKLIEKNK